MSQFEHDSSSALGGVARHADRFPVRTWFLAISLGVVVIFLYWPATSCDIILIDDHLYITSVQVPEGLTWDGFKLAFMTPVGGNWHPLTMLSYMLDCQLFGLSAWGHHFVNVLLHAANTVLVFLLLEYLTRARWRSLFVAAFFGFHPLHVESVAWVAERKDVLSTFFGLLSLIFYANYAKSETRNQKLKNKNYLLCLLFLSFGLMSKPMLVTWPFVMLLLDYWPLERFKQAVFWRLVIEKIPFFILVAVTSIVTFIVQKLGGYTVSIEHMPMGARCENAMISYCRYLGKLFWPEHLAIFYLPGNWQFWAVAGSVITLTGITAVAWLCRRSLPFILMGWLWFLGTLIPVIGLVQVGFQTMADRYSYISSLGMFIVVVWGVHAIMRNRRHREAASAVGVGALICCFVSTRQQLGYWQNSETLMRHALKVTKNNYAAHYNLGSVFLMKGEPDKAIEEFEEAIRLKPDYVEANCNLANTLEMKGQLDEAIRQYLKTIQMAPNYADAHNKLGVAYASEHRLDEAIEQFREAIRLDPNHAVDHYNLAVSLGMKDQLDEAIEQYKEAIRLEPLNAQPHYNLGTVLGMKGQLDEAIRQFQETIRLKPDLAMAYDNLGVAYEKEGKTDDAIKQLQAALQLNPNDAEVCNDLGIALYAKGRPDEAIKLYEQAIRLRPAYAEACFNLGTALYGKRQPGEALREFEEAVRLRPDYVAAYNSIGIIFAGQGQLDKAISALQKAVQIDPNNAQIRSNLAQTLQMKNGTNDINALKR
jgi:protein O-mannosyl-transferase